jgi:hypothetical protein
MRVLDELEHEIERIARAAGDARPSRRWWRKSALLALLPLGLATVAVGAVTSGILAGEPVENPPGLHLNPKSGLGVAVGAGKLLSVRAADPAGGPPWALRVVTTSRGLGCVQPGRVVGGKLGVLGRDGAFKDDGKFHERGAEVIQPLDCQQTDGAGHTFLAMSAQGVPASADGTGCVPRDYGGAKRPLCPPGSLRTILYGLLGPEATAVTYHDRTGRVVRAPVSRPEGAYLVVLPIDPKRKNFYFSPGATPAGGLLSVEYRDGTSCQLPHPPDGCPLNGYVAPKLPPVSRGQLAATVHVSVGTRAESPERDVAADQRRITVTFRARQPADARSFYTIGVQVLHGGKHCSAGRLFGPIAKDVKAGTVLTRTEWMNYRCRGMLKVNVGYTQQRRPSQMPFDVAGLGDDDKVGSVTVKLG